MSWKLGNVVMVKPDKPMADEARWRCSHCGKELAYSQPVSLSLSLDLVKLFGEAHQSCSPVTGKEAANG